jgi:hypothetical protein
MKGNNNNGKKIQAIILQLNKEELTKLIEEHGDKFKVDLIQDALKKSVGQSFSGGNILQISNYFQNEEAEAEFLNVLQERVIDNFEADLKHFQDLQEIRLNLLKERQKLGENGLDKEIQEVEKKNEEHKETGKQNALDEARQVLKSDQDGQKTETLMNTMKDAQTTLKSYRNEMIKDLKEALGGEEKMESTLVQGFGGVKGRKYSDMLKEGKLTVSTNQEFKELGNFGVTAVRGKWKNSGKAKQFLRRLGAEITKCLNSVEKCFKQVEKGLGEYAKKVLEGRKSDKGKKTSQQR